MRAEAERHADMIAIWQQILRTVVSVTSQQPAHPGAGHRLSTTVDRDPVSAMARLNQRTLFDDVRNDMVRRALMASVARGSARAGAATCCVPTARSSGRAAPSTWTSISPPRPRSPSRCPPPSTLSTSGVSRRRSCVTWPQATATSPTPVVSQQPPPARAWCYSRPVRDRWPMRRCSSTATSAGSSTPRRAASGWPAAVIPPRQPASRRPLPPARPRRLRTNRRPAASASRRR